MMGQLSTSGVSNLWDGGALRVFKNLTKTQQQVDGMLGEVLMGGKSYFMPVENERRHYNKNYAYLILQLFYHPRVEISHI